MDSRYKFNENSEYEGDDGKNERCEERIYKLKAIL